MSSSNCPPQLQLSLPANTTSFKRSFEQFGFDLESPVTGNAEPGGSNHGNGSRNRASATAGSSSSRTGNERKRARSASSFSDGNDSLRSSGSSTFTASSDTSLSEDNEPMPESSGSSSSRLAPSLPPRLPTPDIDIDMPDYRQETAATEEYRISLEQFHQFDSEIDVLRHSRSPSLHSQRSPTPPPTLPPLSLEQSGDLPFLHSPTSPDRLSFDSPSSNEDLLVRGLDAPPRLPSPVHDSSPTLSATISPSDPPIIDLNADDIGIDDALPAEAEPSGRYVSFRERLNTAVELLEADDVSAFRERLTSALDAVRPDNRQSDVERSNSSGNSRHIRPHDGRGSPAQAGLSGSRPWQASVLNNIRSDSANPPTGRVPRIRDLFGSMNSESRTRPLYLTPLSRPFASPPVSPSADITDAYSAAEDRYSGSLAVSSLSPLLEHSSSTSHRRPSPPISPETFFHRRPSTQSTASTSSHRQSAPNFSYVNREVARWFEDPTDSTDLPSSFSPARGVRFMRDANEDSDDDWARSLTGARFGRDLSSSSTRIFPSTRRTQDIDDEDREDEDIIASLLSSTQERATSEASSTGATTSGSSVGGSRSVRAPPSLASLMAREDQENDGVIMQAADSSTESEQPTERAREPRRLTDVLSISEYRSQLLTDARRRRYIEQGLLDPRENSERGSSSSAGGRRRSTAGSGNETEPFSAVRLTAHDIPERSSPTPVRWQFSWEDALDQTEPSDDDDAIRREFLDPPRMYQPSRLGSSGNTPRSSLFGRNNLPESSRSQRNEQGSHVPPWSYPEDNTSLTTDGSTYRRLRSRNLPSTRPSASNSLISENAAELRRRTARADLMDHLFSDVAPPPPPPAPISRSSSREYARGRSSLLARLEPVYPSLPPLRSPSPPDFHRSVADVLDAADRETEAQERRAREEELGPFPRRLANLSWLPPPQLSGSLRGSLDIDIGSGSSSDDMRENRTYHRRSVMSRLSDDGMRSRADAAPLRTHTHRSSSSSRPNRPQSSEPSGFFDSQHSSISDMARTIANDRLGYPGPSLRTSTSFLADSDVGASSSRTGGIHEATDNAHHPHVMYPSLLEGERPVNPAPFIPSPDLGALFSRSDIPSSPLDMPILPPGNQGSLHSHPRIDIDEDVPLPRSYVRHRPPYTVRSDLPRPLDVPRTDTDEMLPRSYTYVPSRPDQPSRPAGRPVFFSYTGIDGEPLAHRPFRSSMSTAGEYSGWRNDAHEPPSIPPLSFGEEDFESFSEARSFTRSGAGAESLDAYNARAAQQSRHATTALPSQMRSSERSNQLPTFSRYRARESTRRGEDIHGAITRRARMEESLIEGSVPSTGSASTTALGDESFNHAIDVLRQDGLSDTRSHQLINRYRQRRDSLPTTSTSTSSLWGDLENWDSSANNNPYRFAPWSLRGTGDVGASNSTSSSTATDTTTRMGNAAARRRPSPGPSIERSDGLQDSRPARNRSARFGRHRMPDLNAFGEREFVTLSELVGRSRRPRSNFNLGDYMRDEDFDQSYEGLMSLAATLGEVKPRTTPDHVVAGLKAGFYKDWASEDCDTRCPICLDDYKALDPVLKLNDCPHWLHKGCLEQWLKGASTCPVCRKSVQFPSPHRHSRFRSHFHRTTAATRSSPSQSTASNSGGTSVPTAGPSGSGSSHGSNRSSTETNNPDPANADNDSDSTNDSNLTAARRDAMRGLGLRSRFQWDYQSPSPY